MTRRRPLLIPDPRSLIPLRALAAWRPIVLTALTLLALPACETPGPRDAGKNKEPAAVRVRFHIAATTEQEGFEPAQDEAGQPLFIDPQPFLTQSQIWDAELFESAAGRLVKLEFLPFGAEALARQTRAHRGGRLAVFIDDELIMSPLITTPLEQGMVYLDGDFSAARAQEIVTAIRAQRAALGPRIEQRAVPQTQPAPQRQPALPPGSNVLIEPPKK